MFILSQLEDNVRIAPQVTAVLSLRTFLQSVTCSGYVGERLM
jgi:hypothetical protein